MICLGPLIVNVGSVEQNIKTYFVVDSPEKEPLWSIYIVQKVMSNLHVKQSPRTLVDFIWTNNGVIVWLIDSKSSWFI